VKKEDVPQDAGLSDRWHRVAYALDEAGNYVLVESQGCESVNVTNAQAWELIAEHLCAVRREVEAGTVSTLAYHMARFQMDEALLADYSRFFRWQVRRHLRPGPFALLKTASLQRYADIFGISVAELCALPEQDLLPLPRQQERAGG